MRMTELSPKGIDRVGLEIEEALDPTKQSGPVVEVVKLSRAQLIRAAAVSLQPRNTLDRLKVLGRDPKIRRVRWIRTCLQKACAGVPLNTLQVEWIERAYRAKLKQLAREQAKLQRQGNGYWGV